MVKILAVDQALNHYGASVFDDGKLIFTTAFVLNQNDFKSITSKKDNLAARLQTVYKSLRQLVEDYNPDIIVAEQPWFGANVNVFKIIVTINTFLCVIAWEKEKFFSEINIRKYRCFFKVKGKDQVQKYVKTNYPDVKIDKEQDISDSIMLGEYVARNVEDYL